MFQYGRFLVSSFAFLTLRSWVRRYDLVHVHNMPDVLAFAALVPKLQGAKVMLDLHDPMPELMMDLYGLKSDHWLVRALRTFERWSIAFADIAITPNITFKNLFVSRSCQPEKMIIVMNSPQAEIFDPDRFGQERRPASGEFRIMHHGSIVYRHGIDLLVKAVSQLRHKIPGVRLDIYGGRTSFLDRLLELSNELGIADIVHYHGERPHSEMAEAILKCNVGVVPNRRSAFTEINLPTRLFEYLSMHRPVLLPPPGESATTLLRTKFCCSNPTMRTTWRPKSCGYSSSPRRVSGWWSAELRSTVKICGTVRKRAFCGTSQAW